MPGERQQAWWCRMQKPPYRSVPVALGPGLHAACRRAPRLSLGLALPAGAVGVEFCSRKLSNLLHGGDLWFKGGAPRWGAALHAAACPPLQAAEAVPPQAAMPSHPLASANPFDALPPRSSCLQATQSPICLRWWRRASGSGGLACRVDGHWMHLPVLGMMRVPPCPAFRHLSAVPVHPAPPAGPPASCTCPTTT